MNTCYRCGGSGWIMCYKHVEGGVCFGCDGTGIGHHRKYVAGAPAPKPPVPQEGDYGVAYSAGLDHKNQVVKVVTHYGTWERAKYGKGLKKFADKPNPRIVKFVKGKWLDREEVAQLG